MPESPKLFKIPYVFVSDASDLYLEQTSVSILSLRKSHPSADIALLCAINDTVLKEFKDRDYAVTSAIEKVLNGSKSAFRFSCPKFFNALDSLMKRIRAFVENH